MKFDQKIAEHKLTKPERPNTKLCSPEEWAAFSRALMQWDKELSKLEVSAVKQRVKAAVHLQFNTLIPKIY